MIIQHLAPQPSRTLRSIAAAHPVRTYLVLVFGAGYPLMLTLVLSWHGMLPGGRLLRALPLEPAQVTALLVTWTVLLPAALMITGAVGGRAGVRALLRQAVCWRFGRGWWLVIMAGLPILTVAGALLAGASWQPVDLPRVLLAQLGLLAVNVAVISLAEEVAWTGVVQARLAQRHRPGVAGLLAALPFALLHWPIIGFGPVSVGSALAALVALLVLGALVRPLLGLIMHRTGGSVLAAAVLHAVFNRTNNPDGLVAAVTTGDRYQLSVLAAVLLLTGLLAVRRG